MKIIWMDLASAQLRAIRDSSSRHSPTYPRRIARLIGQKVKLLSRFPLLGSEVTEYADESIRELFEEPYRILYRVADEVILILAVHHVARPLPLIPPN